MNQLLQPQASKPFNDHTKLIECQYKHKWYHNHTAKDLKPLKKGDTVRTKPLCPGEKEWRKVLVVDKHDQWSYTVATSDGQTYRRNHMHLRKTQEPPLIIQQDHWSPPPSNPMLHKPAENPETPITSTPPLRLPNKSS